jgi:hypothetical protein
MKFDDNPMIPERLRAAVCRSFLHSEYDGEQSSEPQGDRPMQMTPNPFLPAQAEVHSAAHNQDLLEVPKQAALDREAEAIKAYQPYNLPEPVSVPGEK